MRPGPAPQLNDAERFWSAVDRKGAEDCWHWLRAMCGGRDGASYGMFTRSRRSPGRRNIYAHRMAYCLANNIDPGAFSGDVFVRHKCDNTRCCNPNHLEPGTPAQNVQDKVERGRALRGSGIKTSTLSEQDVARIKARLANGEMHRVIAADLGVCRAAISQIARGKNWAWVEAAEKVTVVQ